MGFHGFFVFGFKSMTVCPIPASVAYWNGYAPWYRRWRTHNDYHEPILEELGRMVQPGWRILDIGAGDGVLALPLGERGCRVTALEPAIRLRARLVDEARLTGGLKSRSWCGYSAASGARPPNPLPGKRIRRTTRRLNDYFSKINGAELLKRICVIDGQGGGIGLTMIKYLKEAYQGGVKRCVRPMPT